MQSYRPSASLRLSGRAIIVAAGAAALLAPLAAFGAPAAAEDAQLRETWRAAIAATPAPQEGCFSAAYPSTHWARVDCKAAPNRPYTPRHGHRGFTVGNGNDYAAVTSTPTSSAVGSFPSVSGVKSEKGYGGAANYYSLQLNSDFMNTAGCNGSGNSNCQTWEQFVYSSSETAGFMQYWLINYGSPCPAGGGWSAYQGSCYKNSAAVTIPTLPITQLGSLKLSGSAVSGGTDTFVLTTPSKAYSTTGRDSVVYLATAWKASEFNIVGDGGGSAAKFNRGSTLKVQIGLHYANGSSAAPSCASNDGTTGETNNLNLGSCSTAGGSTPSIAFTESN